MQFTVAAERKNWRQRLVAVALALGYVVVAAAAASGADASAAKPAATGTAAVTGTGAKAAPAKPLTPPAAVKPATEAAPDVPETPVGTGETIQTAPSGDGTIELHAKNEDLANVLEMLSQKYQLNIIVTRGAKGRVTVDLYKATVASALDAMCRANNLKWSREDNSIYVFTAEEGAAMRLDEARLVTEVFPLNYLSGEDAMKFVAPALSSKGVVAVNLPAEKGIPSGASAATGGNSFGLQDSLVVRDFPENLAAIRDILKSMDRRPRQVLVEATILQVKLDDNTSLGINFNTLAGVDFKELTTTTGIPAVNPGGVANATTTTVPASTMPWASIGTQGFATPGTGLNFGVITNNVSFFINALETVSDTTILSNPKVLALNKQRAEVIVGERLGYRTTTTTETSTIQTVQFLDTGTQLVFRPFISDDGFIRMEIHPKVSSGDVIDDLPRETTTEVTCNIMVKDGHTIVIGGLFDETASISRSQVPGLGNIPGLDWLFRKNTDKSARNEIVVLLTPHIIDNVEAADEVGQQFLEDGKRHCLGIRENFAFFTRERIGVAYLMEADRAWTKFEKTGQRSDLDWALWNVQLALNVGPNNLKALRLKDKILSEKRGGEYQAPNWTIWDSLQERLKEMDEAKADAAAATAALESEKPPAAASAPAPATSSAAPAVPVARVNVNPTAQSSSIPAAAPVVAPKSEESTHENH
jgi:type IV pilus assembly protein PilQ